MPTARRRARPRPSPWTPAALVVGSLTARRLCDPFFHIAYAAWPPETGRVVPYDDHAEARPAPSQGVTDRTGKEVRTPAGGPAQGGARPAPCDQPAFCLRLSLGRATQPGRIPLRSAAAAGRAACLVPWPTRFAPPRRRSVAWAGWVQVDLLVAGSARPSPWTAAALLLGLLAARPQRAPDSAGRAAAFLSPWPPPARSPGVTGTVPPWSYCGFVLTWSARRKAWGDFPPPRADGPRWRPAAGRIGTQAGPLCLLESVPLG